MPLDCNSLCRSWLSSIVSMLNSRIQEKLRELDWYVLPHPLYSPGPASSDYCLLRPMNNHLDRRHFESLRDINSSLLQFFWKKQTKLKKRFSICLKYRGNCFLITYRLIQYITHQLLQMIDWFVSEAFRCIRIIR